MEKLETKPLGVIDALSNGFELVLRRPWVLLIPVALDLFLWLGPQISARPLFDQWLGLFTVSPVDASPEAQQNLAMLKEALQSAGDTVNVLGVLTIGLPTLTRLQPPQTTWTRSVWFVVPNTLTLLALSGLLALIGILLASLYLESLARAVRRDKGGALAFALRVIKSYANMTALIGLAAIATLVFIFPLSLTAALANPISQGLASFLVFVGLMLVVWAALYLAFAIPAIFVSGAHAGHAVLNSISIFRYSFWSAMGLVFLVYLLQMGFSIVWQQLGGSPWGVMFDILANAFLGSGLVAGSMVFYHDRITLLIQVRERIRQQQPPLKS